LAALVAAVAGFVSWAGVAQAAEVGGPRAEWSPGPNVGIVKPLLFRLSADRILAVRVRPRSCLHSGPYGACKRAVYDRDAAEIVDVGHGTSIPAAGPPPGMRLGSFPVTIDGDLYVPTEYRDETTPQVLLRYEGAGNRWDVLQLPPGVPALEDGRMGLVAVGNRLAVVHAGRSDTATPAGIVQGSDGRWRPLPPNPLFHEGFGARAMAGGLVTFQPTKDTTEIATLAISDDGHPAAAWTRLPAASLPIRGAGDAVIGDYLIWPEATYNLRTGRTERIVPQVHPGGGGGRVSISDGKVVGDWFCILGRLFNPITRIWISIPEVSTAYRPRSYYPNGESADYRVDEAGCPNLGGPQNLVRFCDPPEHLYSPTNPWLGYSESIGPETTEVLRVSERDARG
jgi:hypothetical protein